MSHDPDSCTVPQCLKCEEAWTTVSVVTRDDTPDTDTDTDPHPDDDRDRAFGGRLVKVDDPRKVDPSDAEPLPTGGRLSSAQVE